MPISTIKLTSVRPAGGRELELGFSDGSLGIWSAAELMSRDTILTRPLSSPDFLHRAFIDGGALAWPNGLELAPYRLHQQLSETGALRQRAA